MITLSLRVHESTKNTYEELKENKTADDFLSTLLEYYQNPKKVIVSDEKDKEKIKELNNAILEKETELKQLNEQIKDLTEQLKNSNNNNKELHNIINNNIIFEIKDDEKLFLNNTIIYYKNKGVTLNEQQALYLLIKQNLIKR